MYNTTKVVVHLWIPGLELLVESDPKKNTPFPEKKKIKSHKHTHNIYIQFQWVQRVEEVYKIQV